MPIQRELTSESWRKEAEARFGPYPLKWAFVCPACGHVATVADWKRVGAAEGEIAFSCIGRHIPGSRDAFSATGPGPCNYAGGGLFRLNPVRVVTTDPEKGTTIQHDIFEFAPASGG